MLPEELAVDHELDPSAQLVDRLLAAEAKVRANLVALRADPAFPIDRLRVFDYEEDADDASVRVLAEIGQDPTALGDFLLHMALKPGDQAKCIANVAADTPIPYGQFLNAHPLPCWRYSHIRQFAKALQSCPH